VLRAAKPSPEQRVAALLLSGRVVSGRAWCAVGAGRMAYIGDRTRRGIFCALVRGNTY